MAIQEEGKLPTPSVWKRLADVLKVVAHVAAVISAIAAIIGVMLLL